MIAYCDTALCRIGNQDFCVVSFDDADCLFALQMNHYDASDRGELDLLFAALSCTFRTDDN